MKRQTRPFVVEIKQSRHGSGKAAPKPLWSGRDLLLLKEAQPEPEIEPADLPPVEQRPAKITSSARILEATTPPAPIEEPEEPEVELVVPAKPRKPRTPKPSAAPLRAPAAAVAPKAKFEFEVEAEAEIPVERAGPLRLRNRAKGELPPGQRWKRRLPKVLR